MSKRLCFQSDPANALISGSASFTNIPKALLEFIHNSIDYNDEVRPNINVGVDYDRDEIVISDNARGMTLLQVENFLNIGFHDMNQKVRTGRNKYGNGSKYAMFSLANRVVYHTFSDNREIKFEINCEKILKNKKAHGAVKLITNERKKAGVPNGTIVTMTGIRRKNKNTLEEVANAIQGNLKQLLSTCDVKFNDKLLTYQRPSSVFEKTYHDNNLGIDVQCCISDVNLMDSKGLNISVGGVINEVYMPNSILGFPFNGKLHAYIDDPKLALADEDGTDSTSQARDMKLNRDHSRVRSLIAFADEKLLDFCNEYNKIVQVEYDTETSAALRKMEEELNEFTKDLFDNEKASNPNSGQLQSNEQVNVIAPDQLGAVLFGDGEGQLLIDNDGDKPNPPGPNPVPNPNPHSEYEDVGTTGTQTAKVVGKRRRKSSLRFEDHSDHTAWFTQFNDGDYIIMYNARHIRDKYHLPPNMVKKVCCIECLGELARYWVNRRIERGEVTALESLIEYGAILEKLKNDFFARYANHEQLQEV